MKNNNESFGAENFVAGKKIQINKDGSVKLPVSLEGKEQEVLFVQTKDDYRLIPLLPDVKKIYIEVTTDCNFDCITCIRNSWKDCIEHMDWNTFKNILNNIDDLPDLKAVHFGGFGEPMKHPEIFDMIAAVKERGLKAEMISNGSYLSRENINRLIDLGTDVLFISIDSPDEEEYNEIRQGADFNSVFQNISNLQAVKEERKVRKPELGIEFVAMKRNFNSLPKLIQMAHDLKARQIIVSNLLPYHESMKDEIVYDADDTGYMFGIESMQAVIKAKMSNMKLRSERECKFVKDKALSINYRGDVSPCYSYMHTYETYIYGRKKEMHAFYLGNVNDKKLKDIWMDPGYVNFRRIVNENLFPSCTDCKSLDGCSYTDNNQMDCWGNSPSCSECLWARRIIACP